MQQWLTDYEQTLSRLHERIGELISEAPAEALDWSPGPEMNSLAVLVAHTAGSQRYWVGRVAGQQPLERDRPAEFRTAGLDAAELAAKLDSALADTRQVLAGLTADDLSAGRWAPMQEREVTVGWALLHAVEHTGLHLGHMQLTCQLYDRQANGG
ncbi:MAG: DinB family protein [Candidatus Promineifilaceae bacterium]